MLVINKYNPEELCPCGSWLDHWKKFSKKSPPTKCPVKGCDNKPWLAIQVQIGGQFHSSTGLSLRIIPICEDHANEVGNELDIHGETAFVSANLADACEK